MVIMMTNKYAIIENTLVTNVAVADAEFAQSQGWVSCPEEVSASWTYVNDVFMPPTPYVPSADDNKSTAVNLLQATDWTSIPDVADSTLSNPYLTNQADFFAYRSALRAIAVNPTEGNLDWPTKPQEQWSNN
jgi:hypothetical protein